MDIMVLVIFLEKIMYKYMYIVNMILVDDIHRFKKKL